MPWEQGTPAVAFHMRRGDVGCASQERMALTAIGNGWGDPNSEASHQPPSPPPWETQSTEPRRPILRVRALALQPPSHIFMHAC